MIDLSDMKQFGLGLAAINGVRKRIVYMTHDTIVFFYRCLYNIVYCMVEMDTKFYA